MKFFKLLVSYLLLSPKVTAEAVNKAASVSELDRDVAKRAWFG